MTAPTYADVPVLIGTDQARALMLASLRLLAYVRSESDAKLASVRYSDEMRALACACREASR